jgi:hypothetical protein
MYPGRSFYSNLILCCSMLVLVWVEMGQERDEFTVFTASEVDIFFCCWSISLFSVFLTLLCNVFLTFFFFFHVSSPASSFLLNIICIMDLSFFYLSGGHLPPHQPSRDSLCLSYLFYLLLSTWPNHCFARIPSFAISCYGNRQSVGSGDTMPSQNWQEETLSSICGGW